MSSSTADNKQIVARYLQSLSGNEKTRERMAQFVSDTSLLDHIDYIESAFPRYELIADETVAENDLVVVRGTFRGVHRGDFAGIQPTGKLVSAGLMIMYRIEGGKIANHWLQFDSPTLLAQLQESVAAGV